MYQVDDYLQCWHQRDQKEDQWISPRCAGEVLSGDAAAHVVEYDNRDDLEDIRQQWYPCLVVLVCVRDRFRELCSKLEDDEGYDEPNKEYRDASDGYGAACDVLADPWKTEYNRLDNH